MTADDLLGADGTRTLVADFETVGFLAKAYSIATLRPKLRRELSRAASEDRSVPIAVYPTLAAPAIVFELQGSARQYAEANLLPHGRQPVERWLAALAGCSPMVAGVALAGEKDRIRQVACAVAKLTSQGHGPTDLTAIEIHTTRPVYLLFAPKSNHPAWVAKLASRAELIKGDNALRQLHKLLPRIVAEPVALEQLPSGSWMHVQRGLPGVPWFRFSSQLATVDDWLVLHRRAIEVLRQFQAAVKRVPDWSSPLVIADALREQISWYRDMEDSSPIVVEVANRAACAFDALGSQLSPWQHGDYCFNNLLVSNDRVALIDFEEFGHTSMPLHDELSLAFSTYDFTRGLTNAPSLGQLLDLTIPPASAALGFGAAQVEGLLFHHLLWRIRQSISRPKRAEVMFALKSLLENLAQNPTELGIAG